MNSKNMKTNLLDLFSIDTPEKTFYFIWNIDEQEPESDGMDLSSALYMLMFKARSYQENVEWYLKLLMQKVKPFKETDYYTETWQNILHERACKNEKFLWRNWPEPVDMTAFKFGTELEAMEQLAKYNPGRAFGNGFSSKESNARYTCGILAHFFSSEKRTAIKKLSKVEFEEFILTDEPKIMNVIKGDRYINELFRQSKKHGLDCNEVRFRINGLDILHYPELQENTHYVRIAIDNVKHNHQKLKQLYNELTEDVRELTDVVNFYKWHREC
jgi:hypothetical protein